MAQCGRGQSVAGLESQRPGSGLSLRSGLGLRLGWRMPSWAPTCTSPGVGLQYARRKISVMFLRTSMVDSRSPLIAGPILGDFHQGLDDLAPRAAHAAPLGLGAPGLEGRKVRVLRLCRRLVTSTPRGRSAASGPR